MKLTLSILTYSLGLLLYSSAWAWNVSSHEQEDAMKLTPNLENGRKIYETCAICHSPQGWGTPDGRYPQIAGQHASVLIKQLADIRAGNRDNPTMYPFATNAHLNTQGIADVAAYIAQLPMSPMHSMNSMASMNAMISMGSIGPGFHLERGKQVYKENCAECHGDDGAGDAGELYPVLYGQHYQYMLRQMMWIVSGKRRNADATMVKQLREIDMRDLRAAIDYASRLQPPKEKLAETPDWKNPDFKREFISVPALPFRPFQALPFQGEMSIGSE